MKTPTETIPLFRKKDIFILSGLLFFLLLVWLTFFYPTQQKAGSQITLRVDGQIHLTLSLNEDTRQTVENNGHSLTVVVENRTAKVTDSTCQDKLCERAGTLENAGDTAVCLPANISVTVEGTSAPDGITY